MEGETPARLPLGTASAWRRPALKRGGEAAGSSLKISICLDGFQHPNRQVGSGWSSEPRRNGGGGTRAPASPTPAPGGHQPRLFHPDTARGNPRATRPFPGRKPLLRGRDPTDSRRCLLLASDQRPAPIPPSHPFLGAACSSSKSRPGIQNVPHSEPRHQGWEEFPGIFPSREDRQLLTRSTGAKMRSPGSAGGIRARRAHAHKKNPGQQQSRPGKPGGHGEPAGGCFPRPANAIVYCILCSSDIRREHLKASKSSFNRRGRAVFLARGILGK